MVKVEKEPGTIYSLLWGNFLSFFFASSVFLKYFNPLSRSSGNGVQFNDGSPGSPGGMSCKLGIKVFH